MNLKKKNKIDKFLNENLFLEKDFNNIELIKKNILSEVVKNEEEVNKLFERKGVAMYDFKFEIQNIVDYILNIFYDSYKNINWISSSVKIRDKEYNCTIADRTINFQIPKSLTKKISFIKDLTINVEILAIKDINIDEKIKATASLTSFAKLNDKRSLNFWGNKIKKGDIVCGLVSINGILKKEQVSLKLYHELGHYFQDFNLQKNKNSLFNQTVRDSYYKNKNVFTTSENQYIRKIGEILYSLFNKNELSQHASGIYSELVELSPSMNNINDVFKQTTTYNWYKQMLENVNELSNYKSVDIWEAARLFYKTKSHPNGYINLTPYNFKEKFIKLSVKNLNVFYRKMMNAVELYIEEKNQ